MKILKEIAAEFDIGWRFVLVVVGMVVIVAGVLIAKTLNDKRYAQNGPGELLGASLATLASGRPVVVVTASVHIAHNNRSGGEEWDEPRLEVIDAADGRLVARTLVTVPTECVVATPGALWCDTNLTGGSVLHLRDAETLDVRVEHEKLVATAPKLALGGDIDVDVRSGTACLPTSDGRYWHVNPSTVAGTVTDYRPPEHVDVRTGRQPLASHVDSDIGGLYFEGSPRATLMTSDGRGTTRVVATEPWLHPEVLVETTGPVRADPPALTLEKRQVLLIAHDDSVDHDSAQVSITAQGLDGARRWSTSIGHAEIRAAWLVGEALVLALHTSEQGQVMALATSDGHVLWKTGT